MTNPYEDLEITPQKAKELAIACKHLADHIEAYLLDSKQANSFGFPLVYKAAWQVERIINPRFEPFYQYTAKGKVTDDVNPDRGLSSACDNRTQFVLEDPLWISCHHIVRNCLDPFIEHMGWQELCRTETEPTYRSRYGAPTIDGFHPISPAIPAGLRLHARLLEQAANEPIWPAELSQLVPELKGKQQRVLEMLLETCTGRVPLSTLAADPGVYWEIPYDKSWEGVQTQINRRLKPLGWELARSDSDAKLQRIQSP